MEIWDGYRKDGTLAGCDLVRGELIPEGLYHVVSEVLVQHIDGSYLLMQRDYSKEGYPGFFEATAGGSALKGESAIEAAERELLEETGVNGIAFTLINKEIDTHSIFHSYLCTTNCDKQAVTLQKGETIDYRWVTKAEFLRFINSKNCIPTQKKRYENYLNTIK